MSETTTASPAAGPAASAAAAPVNGSDAMPAPWADFWNRYIEASREQTKVLMDSLSGRADLESLRRKWLDSLSESMDRFLRSPMFLDAMRKNFEAISTFRANAEEMAQEMARELGIPRMADISGLFERLRLAQDTVLNRLDRIEKRLDALEASLKR